MHTILGSTLKNQGQLDEAIQCFRTALEIDPESAGAHNNLGNIFKDQGKLDDAIACYQRTLQIEPDRAGTHRNLSGLKKYQSGDDHLETMKALYQSPDFDQSQRCDLCFALAKAHEDIGATDEAFGYMQEGNRIRKAELAYDPGQDRKLFARIREIDDAIADIPAQGDTGGVIPVFILGMPRSGTTLVEQIVASHSRVHGAGELRHLTSLCMPLTRQSGNPSKSDLENVRDSYLQSLSALAQGCAFVTDKMPHNFRWIGFIAKLMPQAKIIHVRRDARAVCWSNYKNYFTAQGLGYAHDLHDAVAYHNLYTDLMQRWNTAYPDRIYNLDYERLTENQEAETRNLIAHLGLDWEDACLEFHKNKRSVQTVSQQQVRKKMYTGSSEQWRAFEPHLKDAFAGLAS